MHITVLRTLHFSKCLINIFHWQELVEAYAAEAKSSGKPQLMLTAAVSAGKGTIDAGYEIAKYCRFLLGHADMLNQSLLNQSLFLMKG